MYGKATRVRVGKETTWGVAPSGGWTAVACGAKASLSSRLDAKRFDAGAAAGAAYAAASFEAPASELDLAALSGAGLWRDGDGQLSSYTIQVADAAGAREVRGAFVRRLKVRAGIAREVLQASLEWVGKACSPCASFGGAAAGKPFTFKGAAVEIDGVSVAAREFSINVNNNVFVGPPADDAEAAFITAGRQELTGYIIVADDRRDIVDGEAHAFAITLAGNGADAVISPNEPGVFFTWAREIRSLSAGALQVLYFEGATAGLGSGLSITLS